MPKRKAPQSQSAPNAADAATNIASPDDPRKKTKQDALSAAKSWHDRRNSSNKSTAEGGAGSSSSAKKVNGNINVATLVGKINASVASSSKVVVTAQQSILSDSKKSSKKKSPLLGDDVTTDVFNEDSFRKNDSSKSSSNRGGKGGNSNALLRSLRKEKESGAKRGSLSSNSTNETPPPSSTATSLSTSDASISSKNDEKNGTAQKSTDSKSGTIIGEALIILCLIALSVIAAIFIHDQQTSDKSLIEEHALEVSRLKAEIAISREVEVVLRSKISSVILELEQQSHQWETEDLGVVPTLYDIEILAEKQGNDDDDDGLQSPEAKNDWLEGIRLLTVEKHLGLNELESKLVDFGVVGGKEKIQALEED